jgi:hypothetical protein
MYDFLSVITLIRVQNLSLFAPTLGKIAHFFTFILYQYWDFVKGDKLLSQLIKFKYENIKLKKRM